MTRLKGRSQGERDSTLRSAIGRVTECRATLAWAAESAPPPRTSDGLHYDMG